MLVCLFVSLSDSFAVVDNNKKRSTKQIFKGSIYWIPEETHQLNSVDLDHLKISNGSVIQEGTYILPNIVSNTTGFVQIDEYNSELTIKPGELYEVNQFQSSGNDKNNRFVKPGEVLFSTIFVQKLSYLEFIDGL